MITNNKKFLLNKLNEKSKKGLFNTKYKKLHNDLKHAISTKNDVKINKVLKDILKKMEKITSKKDKSEKILQKELRKTIRKTIYSINPKISRKINIYDNKININKKININIYWIRHTYSCGNIMEYFGILKILKSPENVPDTPLSGLGILQATLLGLNSETRKILQNADFYGCSTLTRTLQTALFSLYNIVKSKNNNIKQLHVLPFINEKLKKEYMTMELKTYALRQTTPISYIYGKQCQKDVFNEIASQIGVNTINWDLYDKIYKNDRDCKKESKIMPSYNKFLNIILPEIIKKIYDKNKTDYNICLFSHGTYIRNDILKNPDYNTGVYKKKVNQNLLEDFSKYEKVYPPDNLNTGNLNDDINKEHKINSLTEIKEKLFNNNLNGEKNYQLYKDINSDLCFYNLKAYH